MRMARVVLAVSAVMAGGAAWGQAAGQAGGGAEGQAEIAGVESKTIKARPLPLESVRLTGGPLKAAQEADGAFLLRMEPDRALSALRTAAGLEAKGQPLGGWDRATGRQLTGHIAGHLLSALSLMYAATGDERYKQRADYMVSELAAIQEKQGDGFIGAQEDGRGNKEKEIFSQVAAGKITANYESLNGLWSPWYVQHKMFAGLRDAYRHTGNKKALDVETKMAAWAEGVLKGISEEQIQKMLAGEFGGMGEVLVDLYADTGDKRWLELSYKFEHKAFIEPLVQGQDKLGNVHGNHNIPTLMGSAERYAVAGKPEDLAAADFFWKTVVNHHTFASGGNSGAQDGEFFPYADKLAAMIEAAPSAPGNESCNVYNMLKLSRKLFSFAPDAAYADYMERALFNHALTQIDPTNGVMAYHVSVGQGVRLDWQGNPRTGMNESLTCCVGTGMENAALYGEGMYFASGDKLWVNVYAASTAEWAEKGVKVAMESDLPEGETTKMTLTLKAPAAFTLSLRRPAWTTGGFAVKVNGEAVSGANGAGNDKIGRFVEIVRTWKTGDVVEMVVPKQLRLEPTADDPTLAAIMWGPLVLAEDLGNVPVARGGRGARGGPVTNSNTHVIVTAEKDVAAWLKPVDAATGSFTANVGRTAAAPAGAIQLHFVPMYKVRGDTYSVYLNVYTPEEWVKKVAAAL